MPRGEQAALLGLPLEMRVHRVVWAWVEPERLTLVIMLALAEEVEEDDTAAAAAVVTVLPPARLAAAQAAAVPV